MPPRLEPHQLHLLRDIANSREPVPVSRVDGRMLRSLKRQALVTERGGLLVATPAAKSLVTGAGPNPAPSGGTHRLTEAQSDLLRLLCRQDGPVPSDHVDRRVARALVARGLARDAGGWIAATPEGAAHYGSHIRRRRRAGAGAESGSRAARGETILRALDSIELAIPKNAEVRVGGNMLAYADDVIAGLREFARRLSREANPSPE